MLDTTIKVKTDTFDGPLSLLLLLIQKEQMSIKELNLTKITKQYLDYLANMKELNFDIAGDYLFLAATLVLLKSKNAVTEEEQAKLQNQLGAEGSLNITSHAELVRRLEELALYQKMGQKLLELPQTGKDIFVKPKVNRKEIVNSILTPMELEKLTDTMIDFIFRQNRKYTVIKRDRLSIKEKLEFLKTYLQVGQKTNLEELLENDSNSRMATTTGEDTAKMSADGKNTIDNVVITFISLLELARLKRVQVFQNESFGQVYVDVVKTLDDFDVTQADGFDEENESKDKIDTQELENMEQVAH
ncbi:ScpA/B protein [Bacteriovorax sp. BAL6_X]|uniref:segregation and condensation protein A n=1 Tax=Bacteriovorax sp. BAL6_X TaxID=1201290 RepID=UPI000385A5A8|nr:segregation/condensation protein A [Bacteriovorax sp. BAL6_X]EPZ50146.1 ScpA/B protein [Bacteriovorax sp. BAL6_X]